MSKNDKQTVVEGASHTKTAVTMDPIVHRRGSISKGTSIRSMAGTDSYQVRNPLTGNYIMKESATGKFVASTTGRPFKGVTVKKTISAGANPHIDKQMAENAEKDMIEVLNKFSN